MDTLSNVNTRRGGTKPPNAGLTSNVIPTTQTPNSSKSSDAGVSSSYVQKENHSWFVLRVTYNRVETEIDTLKAEMDVYLPKCYVIKQIAGKKQRVLQPLLPNLVFVYSTQEAIEHLFKNNPKLSHFHFYRDHTRSVNPSDGYHSPVTIPFNEMMNFIRLTSIKNEHIQVVEPEKCHYKSGEKVRIINGDFAGVEGYVARVSGQQRVVVSIEGLCIVATAYIPGAFLEKV